MQIDTGPPRAKCCAVSCVEDDSPAGTEHQSVSLGKFIHNRRLTRAKGRFTFNFKYGGYAYAGPLLELVVRIHERQTNSLRQYLANRGFASAHQANQKYIVNCQICTVDKKRRGSCRALNIAGSRRAKVAS